MLEIQISNTINSMYYRTYDFFKKFIPENVFIKHAFNWSPMYSRSTGKLYYVSEDMMTIKGKINKTYRNVNLMGSIFGGSIASATDPFFVFQLIYILKKEYTVWDKSSTIQFIRPAYDTIYFQFKLTEDEIINIKKNVASEGFINITKEILLTNKSGTIVYAKVSKTIYIADKTFHDQKLKKRERKKELQSFL